MPGGDVRLRSLLRALVLILATAASARAATRRVHALDPGLPPPADARAATGLARDLLAKLVPSSAVPQLTIRAELRGGAGTTHLRLSQHVAGLPVHHGEHALVLDAAGRPVAFIAGDVADDGELPAFAVDAARAVAIAEASLPGSVGLDPALLVVHPDDPSPGWLRVSVPGRPETFARPVALPRGPRAAWRVEIGEAEDPLEMHAIFVDATTGSIVERGSLTSHVAARGRAYPRGFLSGSEWREFVDGAVLMDPASPEGWIDADRTVGNNAFVSEDRAGDGTATEGLTATGSGDPLTFDFPVTGVPLDDLDAALTNAFWAVNEAHDRFWRLGFDEASGQMQARNFGRGGASGDSVRVFVQSRAGADASIARNTSSASTSADGAFNALTFTLWDRSGELRDGALDTGIVFHEHAHHVVVRMLGGDATCDDGNQPAGLAEGWADYFAAAFTGNTVLGAYVTGNADNGLRTAPIDRSAYSYSSLCATNPNSTACNATENGEIWAGALWDLRREMIRVHGPEGGLRTDRLVFEGLRHAPCRPTYLEARDGILLADLVLSGGADACLVWQAMASRGMGADATSSGPDDRYPLAGYALGPECVGGAALAWTRPRWGDDATARLQLTDGRSAGASRNVAVTSTTGDAETILLPAPAAGPGLVRRAAIELRPGAATPGDGILQVEDGGSISATCTDCGGAPSAAASISRTVSLAVLSHQLNFESCHDDDNDARVSDFNASLPSLLDSGELATVSVSLGNAEEFPLEDVEVTVRSDNPAVAILPAGPQRVGAVDGRWLNPAAFAVSVQALAAPLPAVTFGDRATLTFDVTARGHHGSTTLTLELAGDYAGERAVPAWGGVETFEAASPSAALWTHAPAGGRPGDLWALRDCGNGGGRAMTYAGPSCTDHADTPAAALLQSPPLFDFSGGIQAVRPTSTSWWNDVQLGYSRTPASRCDSEMVVAYVTDDPARPNFANPLSDRGGTLRYWVQWPGLLVTRNTLGWEPSGPVNPITGFTLAGMSLPDVRLMWAFFTDVLNPTNDGGCRITDPEGVGGGYRLDDVSFTYDRVRLVAPTTPPCARTCFVRAALTISPPGGSRCAGDEVTLSAAGSESIGCAGPLEYRFLGVGHDTGYISTDTVTLSAGNGGLWIVDARCSTDTSCSNATGVLDPTLDDSTGGRVRPGSLRVRRDGADVVLDWDGTRSPPVHAIFRADADRADAAARRAGLADLGAAIPSDSLRADTAEGVSWREAGGATGGRTLSAYRVLSALPCGAALDR